MIAKVRSEMSVNEGVLYVAFELGKREWKLALTTGFAVAPWVRTVRGGDLTAVQRVLAQARTRFGVAPGSRVVSCYEAGRDGFWIHRALCQAGLENCVVDSASIEVNRRARRMKTDRLDAIKLVQMLVRVCAGERRVWQEVRVPSAKAEAARHVSRERTALTQEQTRLVNQMRSWLATCGAALPKHRREGWWRTVRDWAGQWLPATLQGRLERAHTRLTVVATHLAVLERDQARAVQQAAPATAAARLVQLKGVAATSASILIDEGLEWRAFENRRQVGGLLGFAPVQYDSGETTRDQGISRAGHKRLQSVMVQLAWSWVHWQRESALTQWYQARFGRGKRARKIGIVALARKLLIALWRWATQGIPPAGAVLKTA